MSKPAARNMSRDELVERVEELETQLEQVTDLIQIRGDGPEGVFINGQPIGKMAVNAAERSKEALEKAEGAGSSGGVSEAVRSQMLPIHRDLRDHREAAKEFSGSELRGVLLFRQFIREMDPDHSMTGVESSHGYYRIKRDRAKQILEKAGALPETGHSTTIKRAMKHLAKESSMCDCDGRCEHELFTYNNDSTYTVSVNAQEWEDYLESIYEAVEGDEVDVSADDAGDSAEDADDEIGDEFDRLADAEPATSNTVVSRGSGKALEGGDRR